MITLTEETQKAIFNLLMSASFRTQDIKIAEHEWNYTHFTIYLEDKYEPKENLADCVQVDIPIEDFKNFIVSHKLNYEEQGSMNWVEIAEPADWYLVNASEYERLTCRETLVRQILKDQLANVQG